MRYSFIVSAVVLALVTPALSQIDAEPDGIGIYADLEATQVNVTATPNDIFPVYLLLTRPTTLTGVSAWACTVVVPSNAQILGWFVPGMSLNVASPPDFVVGRGADPHPVADIIHLMTFYIRMSDTDAGRFYLTGSTLAGVNFDDFPVYLEVGDYSTAHYLHCYPNGEDLPVFAVNAAALATESASWGDVKALFR